MECLLLFWIFTAVNITGGFTDLHSLYWISRLGKKALVDNNEA